MYNCVVLLKWSIFVPQKLALHQNGVEFCQQSNGDIVITLATSYANVHIVRVIQL